MYKQTSFKKMIILAAMMPNSEADLMDTAVQVTRSSVYTNPGNDPQLINFANCSNDDFVRKDALSTLLTIYSGYCCPATNVEYFWYQVKLAHPSVVESVFLFNSEFRTDWALRIIGTDLFVGNDPDVSNNERCFANPTATGMYSCGGRVGTYIGLKKLEGQPSFGHICRILAYSLKPNDF
jgi:hypothetical protein